MISREEIDGLHAEEGVACDEILKKLKVEDYQNFFTIKETLDIAYQEFLVTQKNAKVSIFNLYLIGGNLTKEGDRPDIDLLVATDMWYDSSAPRDLKAAIFWPGCQCDLVQEKILGLTDFFSKIEQVGKLPDDYNIGVTKGKVLFELYPENGGKKIDLSYVRNLDEWSGFHSEEKFIARDVDEKGKPLERLILRRWK